MKFVCADCGNEQDEMNGCNKCKGLRVILQSFAEQTFGPNWRKAFLPKDHPDALKQEDLPPGVTLTDVEPVIYLWWLDQSQTEAAFKSKFVDELPEYLKEQLGSRHGRAGRGRLWVHDSLGDVSVAPWPETDLARRLAEDSGGIAFNGKDIELVRLFPGIITDLNLNQL